MAEIHASPARLHIPHCHVSGVRGHRLECRPPNPWCLALASDDDEHRNEQLRRVECSLKCLAQQTTLALNASDASVSTNSLPV
eukprot:5467429-Pleurochrysis_carterae.AAC.1